MNILVLLFAAAAAAATLPGPYPAEVESARGTVQDIDPAARRVVVVDGRGRRVELEVPPELGDLTLLPRGGTVEVQYVPASAVEISRPGGPTPAAAASQPEQEAVTANVESVDRENRELVLRAGDAQPVRLRVEPGVPGFDEARAGETVTARYVRALALSLTPRRP